MYVPTMGSVMRSTHRGKKASSVEDGSRHRPRWAGVACCGVTIGVALWKDKVISIALMAHVRHQQGTGEVVWERKIAEPAIGETLTIAP